MVVFRLSLIKLLSINYWLSPIYILVIIPILLFTCATSSIQTSSLSDQTDSDNSGLVSEPAKEFIPLTKKIPDTPESIDLIPVPGGRFTMGPFNGNVTH